MARRGRKRSLDTESLYGRLILFGVGMVQACQEWDRRDKGAYDDDLAHAWPGTGRAVLAAGGC